MAEFILTFVAGVVVGAVGLCVIAYAWSKKH